MARSNSFTGNSRRDLVDQAVAWVQTNFGNKGGVDVLGDTPAYKGGKAYHIPAPIEHSIKEITVKLNEGLAVDTEGFDGYVTKGGLNGPDVNVLNKLSGLNLSEGQMNSLLKRLNNPNVINPEAFKSFAAVMIAQKYYVDADLQKFGPEIAHKLIDLSLHRGFPVVNWVADNATKLTLDPSVNIDLSPVFVADVDQTPAERRQNLQVLNSIINPLERSGKLTPNPVAGFDDPRKIKGTGFTVPQYEAAVTKYRENGLNSEELNKMKTAFAANPRKFTDMVYALTAIHYNKDGRYDDYIRSHPEEPRKQDGINFAMGTKREEYSAGGWKRRNDRFLVEARAMFPQGTTISANIAVASNTTTPENIPDPNGLPPLPSQDEIDKAAQNSGAAEPIQVASSEPLTQKDIAQMTAKGTVAKATTSGAAEYQEQRQQSAQVDQQKSSNEAALAAYQNMMGNSPVLMLMLAAIAYISGRDPAEMMSSMHNKAQKDPNYKGEYAQAHDQYMVHRNKESGGKEYPEAARQYQAYRHEVPVDVPVGAMQTNFTIKGGVEVVRDGKLVHNPNNIFARYLIDTSLKMDERSAKLPADAPMVTLSTAHFYRNGTLGARLPNGVWEHERSTYKNDVMSSIYAEAGVKTTCLQKNVMGQLLDIAKSGNGSSVVNYPISQKAADADANAKLAGGKHFTQETHFNNHDTDSGPNGYEIIHGTDASAASRTLAKRISDEQLNHINGLNFRRVFSGEYGFPNQAKSTVLLSEDGFASNAADAARLGDAKEIYKSAYADAKAGIKFGITEQGWKVKDSPIVRECIDELVKEGKNKVQLLASVRIDSTPAPVAEAKDAAPAEKPDAKMSKAIEQAKAAQQPAAASSTPVLNITLPAAAAPAEKPAEEKKESEALDVNKMKTLAAQYQADKTPVIKNPSTSIQPIKTANAGVNLPA